MALREDERKERSILEQQAQRAKELTPEAAVGLLAGQ